MESDSAAAGLLAAAVAGGGEEENKHGEEREKKKKKKTVDLAKGKQTVPVTHAFHPLCSVSSLKCVRTARPRRYAHIITNSHC